MKYSWEFKDDNTASVEIDRIYYPDRKERNSKNVIKVKCVNIKWSLNSRNFIKLDDSNSKTTINTNDLSSSDMAKYQVKAKCLTNFYKQSLTTHALLYMKMIGNSAIEAMIQDHYLDMSYRFYLRRVYPCYTCYQYTSFPHHSGDNEYWKGKDCGMYHPLCGCPKPCTRCPNWQNRNETCPKIDFNETTVYENHVSLNCQESSDCISQNLGSICIKPGFCRSCQNFDCKQSMTVDGDCSKCGCTSATDCITSGSGKYCKGTPNKPPGQCSSDCDKCQLTQNTVDRSCGTCNR